MILLRLSKFFVVKGFFGNQHSQNPQRYKTQKLRKKMEGHRRFKVATTRFKEVKRQGNRVAK